MSEPVDYLLDPAGETDAELAALESKLAPLALSAGPPRTTSPALSALLAGAMVAAIMVASVPFSGVPGFIREWCGLGPVEGPNTLFSYYAPDVADPDVAWLHRVARSSRILGDDARVYKGHLGREYSPPRSARGFGAGSMQIRAVAERVSIRRFRDTSRWVCRDRGRAAFGPAVVGGLTQEPAAVLTRPEHRKAAEKCLLRLSGYSRLWLLERHGENPSLRVSAVKRVPILDSSTIESSEWEAVVGGDGDAKKIALSLRLTANGERRIKKALQLAEAGKLALVYRGVVIDRPAAADLALEDGLLRLRLAVHVEDWVPPKSRAQLDWDAEISFVFDEAFTRELRLAATSRTTAIGVFAALCGVLAALFAFVLFRSRWGESRLTRSTRDVRVYGRVAVSGLGLFLGGVFASLTADVKLQFGAIEVFHVPLTTTLTPVFVAYGVVYGALALLRKTAWTKRITYHLISFVVALPILWFWFSRHEYQAAVTDPGYQLLGMAVVCGLVLLAQFVHRFGLGNGYAVVLAGALRSELNFQNVSLYAFLSVIALLVLVALLLSERAHRRLRHPWLVGAGIPLIATASWSALLLSLSHYGLVADMAIEVVPDLFAYPAHALGGILIFVSPSLLWFIVRFVQAGREERGIRVVGRWKVSARVERMASLVIPAALIVCLSFHYEFGSKPNLDLLLVGLVPSVLLVAIAMDLFHEFVAWRRHSSRVKIAALHRVRETEELRRALEGYDIDALLRGRCLRQLLAFLGPWVPVEVMVPKAQAALAREIVQSTLGPERSKESLLAA